MLDSLAFRDILNRRASLTNIEGFDNKLNQ